MTYRLASRLKSILSFVLAIWFVSFSVLLNAGHHHSGVRHDCRTSTGLCHIEQHTRHDISDDTSRLTHNSVPSEPASSFSSICFVCLLLANYNFEHPVTSPSPFLSDTKAMLDICKTVAFGSSPDQSPDNPRAPPC